MRPQRQAGFTLLEVLVAFVIAAIALGVFYEGTLTGLRSAQLSGNYEQAISLARSHLAELSQRQTGQAVDAQGSDGPLFRYSVRETRLAGAQLQRSLLDQDNNRPARQAALYGLAVTESWTQDGARRQVELLGENMVVQAAPQ